MPLMNAKSINVSIGDRNIFTIKELTIHDGDRIGLVGKNGQGKTLLLNTLLGKFPSSAYVEWKGTYAYLEQLNDSSLHSTLSGGEKTLAKLQSVLNAHADVLLLDEPTNNLDWVKVTEIEENLKLYRGAYLIVSHDRALLDNLCTKIWELEDGYINIFNGNYSFYEEQKELKKRQQYDAFNNYLNEKNRLEARMRQKQDQAKGMRKPPARMGNSEWQLYKNKAAGKQKKVERVSKVIQKRIDGLEKVEKPMEWDKVKMEMEHIYPVHRKTILLARELEVKVSDKLLYHIPNLKLKTGSKTAIIGDNGCGKTTLVKQLISNSDNIEFSGQAKIGRFDQALETLPESETIYSFVHRESSLEQHIIRIILGRLNFSGEAVNKRIGVLSGGERVKVALARLLTGNYNFLILDEPTNHLDFEALQAVESLIRDYPGTVLFVSHDRRFVERTADNIWRFNHNTVNMFEGTLEQLEKSLIEKKISQTHSYYQDEIIKLETKLSEIISKISINKDDAKKEELEKKYQDTLKKLKILRGMIDNKQGHPPIF